MTFVIDGETVHSSRSVNVTVLKLKERTHSRSVLASGEFALAYNYIKTIYEI